MLVNPDDPVHGEEGSFEAGGNGFKMIFVDPNKFPPKDPSSGTSRD